MSKDKLDEDYDFVYSIALFSIKYPTWLLPLSLALFLFPACLSAYVFAVLNEQVPVYMPFISDCITRHPQAGYITVFTAWGSLICKFNINYMN